MISMTAYAGSPLPFSDASASRSLSDTGFATPNLPRVPDTEPLRGS